MKRITFVCGRRVAHLDLGDRVAKRLTDHLRDFLSSHETGSGKIIIDGEALEFIEVGEVPRDLDKEAELSPALRLGRLGPVTGP